MPTVSEGGHGRERAGPGLSTFFLFPMEKGAAGREGGRERAGWKPLLVFHNDYTRTDENDGGERERESDACAHIDLLFLLLFFSVSVLEAVPSLRAV